MIFESGSKACLLLKVPQSPRCSSWCQQPQLCPHPSGTQAWLCTDTACLLFTWSHFTDTTLEAQGYRFVSGTAAQGQQGSPSRGTSWHTTLTFPMWFGPVGSGLRFTPCSLKAWVLGHSHLAGLLQCCSSNHSLCLLLPHLPPSSLQGFSGRTQLSFFWPFCGYISLLCHKRRTQRRKSGCQTVSKNLPRP